jgi:CRP/FNR family transcriptional regulator, cyclic AMP receptor protein
VRGRDSKSDLLKAVPLFAGCSRKELDGIARIADEIDLREGQVLTREGDRGREFFVLIEGTADVHRRGRKINTMTAGDFLGEIALVSDRPRTATVTVTSPIRALVVTDRAFRKLMRDVPSIQMKVLQAVVARLPPDT